MQPVIKWVGGKRQLLEEINKRKPSKIKTYYEPFVGGGAVFIDQANEKTVINDANEELINLYEVIRDEPKKLMKKINMLNTKHLKEPEETYYKIREKDKSKNFKDSDKIERAARFIYLNKTSFNGMYRVNASGYFNVPFNGKEVVNFYNEESLLKLSDFLKKIEILRGDYKFVLSKAKKGDFVYFDPPYDKLNDSTFDSYTNLNTVDLQVELATVCDELNKKGVNFMVSNHNTDKINKLYKKYNIDVVGARRNINSNGTKRGKVEEVIITNYTNYENKGVGAGGAVTNKSGLKFEKNILNAIEETLEKNKYKIKIIKLNKIEYKVLKNKNGQCIGIFLDQKKIYNFLKLLEIDYRIAISKEYRPDFCYLNFIDSNIYVIEAKNQNTSGSVDEKIQTGDFKRKQFLKISKLFKDWKIENVKYIYILKSFFKHERYNDVWEYLEENSVEWRIENYDLDILGELEGKSNKQFKELIDILK